MKRSIAVLSMLASMVAVPAKAESGRLNLHIDGAFGGTIVGPASYQSSGDEHSVGGVLGLGLDYQIRSPIAIEAMFHAGGFSKPFPTSSRTGVSLVGASFGVRLRFLDDTHGYLGERNGNSLGNLYGAARIGWYQFDAVQLGFDFTVGYEFSVHRPISIGPMVRMTTLVGGSNDGADVILVAGVGASFEAIRLRARDDGDGDGLDDADERRRGTNPRIADTDRDGISDGTEVDAETDPLVADSDGDGIGDGTEDDDGDGTLDDGETDPRNFDTDGGGISDGDELITLHSDPRNPRDDDSDADGVPDDADSCANTPAGAAVDHAGCPSRQAEAAIHAIAFVPNRSRIAETGEAALTIFARGLGTGHVRIRVFVMGTGNGGADLALATRRADVISTWLVQHDVPRDRFAIEAVGADEVAGRTADANVATISVVRE